MTRRCLPLLFLLVAWLLYLGVQRGDEFDESEHCHVAWMMGRMHEQPLRDFFQHHEPVLWDLLKTYYLVGADGPEVLYFGRALVVVCAFLFAVGAFLLARNWAKGNAGATAPGLLGGLLAVAPLVFMSVTLRTVLVIRPETVGLPLVVLALVCWTWPGEAARRWGGLGRGLLTGLLFGAAVYASPRFALLSGAFLLLPSDRGRWFSLELRPLLAAVGAAVAFVGGYQFLTTGGLSDLYFNLAFSSITYKVSDAHFRPIPQLFVFAGELVLAGAWVYMHLDGLGRRRFLVQGAYLLLVTAASLMMAYPTPYPQNFIAVGVWMSAMFACAAGRMKAVVVPNQSAAPARWALVVAGVCLLIGLRDLMTRESIVARVQQKHAVLALLRPGERVLLAALFHPICASDATYYGNPIVDDDDHYGKAVAAIRERRWELPDCDYLRDILDRKPALVDDYLFRAMPEREREHYREVLKREYTLVDPFPAYHRCYRRNERLAMDAAER
jgi:hypothetical protein